MHYPIPANSQEIVKLQQHPVDEELIAAAIAGAIRIARSKGQSLDDLTAELLAEDGLLEQSARQRLSDIVIQAWARLP